MWSSQLNPSKIQRFIITLFYLLLAIISLILLKDTYIDDLLFLIVLVLVWEWRKAWLGCNLIRRELAIFYPSTEIYWSKKRWFIYQKPIFLRYMVIMKIKAKQNGKKRVLVIMCDSLSVSDWRSLNYFLRQLFI
ncbi:protein YgfX [Orbaceae bacterium ac157xtp]